MTQRYDAIVIGARCGGSPTAMLLARKDYRVLMVDRATFPSDTVSTHFIHAPGMAALERWGLRDTLAMTGCPQIRQYSLDFGPFTIAGPPRGVDGVREAYCPRRPVLDTMLVHAAADAGVEVRGVLRHQRAHRGRNRGRSARHGRGRPSRNGTRHRRDRCRRSQLGGGQSGSA